MQATGRRLRSTAVLALVILTGCGSSGQDHGSSSTSGSHSPSTSASSASTGTADGDSDSGGDGGLRDGVAKLVSCATRTRPYATVEVTNPNDRAASFEASVYFMGSNSLSVDDDSKVVPVPAKGSRTVRVAFDESHIDDLDHCQAEPTAYLAS